MHKISNDVLKSSTLFCLSFACLYGIIISLLSRGVDLGGTVPQKFEVGGRPMHWSPKYLEK